MARARRCLLAGQLIGLAFDPLAHSEGWGEGVMGAPRGCLPLRSPPLICPAHPLLPSFVYPFCCFISLTVLFPTQVPLKNPAEVRFYEV